jgi:anti-sigma regulatory factor (Ser/Thr protein kinase)
VTNQPTTSPDPGTPHIRVELLSNPIYLSGARELVGSVAKRLGFDDLECSKITLAVDEALCNVIRHGYQRQADRPIWISLWPLGSAESPEGIRVVIEDEARQVEPEQLKGRDLADIKPGGLGVHIIREVMDEAVYEKRSPKGMKLTMCKRAPRPAEAPRMSEAAACRPAATKPAARS